MTTTTQADGSSSRADAVLIDYGGVLTLPIKDAFADLSAELGLPPDTALRLVAEHEPTRRALVDHEKGLLDDAGFEHAFAAALSGGGADVPAEGLLTRLGQRLDLDEAMIDWVRDLRRRGVPVAMVSNSLGRDCYARIDQDELFDVSVISAEAGVRKPSREIYRIATERLGVAPDRCVLVDDLQHNLDGAARLDIHGVRHRDARETISQVESLLADAAVAPGPTSTTKER